MTKYRILFQQKGAFMKNKSLLFQVATVIIVGVLCVLITLTLTVLAGSLSTEIFDFTNLNFSNMIPVFLVGIFITCAIVGICVLFVLRTSFNKAKEYLEKEKNTKNGGNNK